MPVREVELRSNRFPEEGYQIDFKGDDEGKSIMYIRTYDGLGRDTTQLPSALPKTGAAEALKLRKAAQLARSVHIAVQEITQSAKFLATSAQQDLLKEVTSILGIFFPSGYGVIDQNGKVIKYSTRYRTEVIPKSPPSNVPFYFHHDTRLFISFQKSNAAGRQRPFAPGHRNWILLYTDNLSSDTPTLARTLIHEMMHMLSHRYRSIEEKFGARVSGEIPTKAAGVLLDPNTFAQLRQVMEQHFVNLVNFLNRQPHRAGTGMIGQLSSSVAATWGAHVVEEVLAFIFTERSTMALAQFQATKSRIGLSQNLVPMQFLKDYFRTYWLSDPQDRAALQSKNAEQFFSTMEADLMKLVAAVEKQIGP